MEDEYVEDQASSDLARAVMEQSKALTALVSQIASSSGEDSRTSLQHTKALSMSASCKRCLAVSR
jgi:gas vesicle protein